MFKVKDKVKVIKVMHCAPEETLNEIGEIEEIKEYKNEDISYLVKFYKKIGGDNTWFYDERELKLVEPKTFTKSDLKDGDIVTYRNGNKRMVQNGEFRNKNDWMPFESYTTELKEKDGNEQYDVIKVERPVQYETVFERKEEILDEAEKRYLRDVIRPFRKDIEYISKIKNETGLYINVSMKKDSLNFPYLADETMYKGMKADKIYSLEELGL